MITSLSLYIPFSKTFQREDRFLVILLCSCTSQALTPQLCIPNSAQLHVKLSDNSKNSQIRTDPCNQKLNYY